MQERTPKQTATPKRLGRVGFANMPLPNQQEIDELRPLPAAERVNNNKVSCALKYLITLFRDSQLYLFFATVGNDES